MIQASLVDTWAATAAGAYTLTENSLYTTEAFGEYIDHLSDDGVSDDHALGVRRAAPRVAGPGGVLPRAGWTRRAISRSCVSTASRRFF